MLLHPVAASYPRAGSKAYSLGPLPIQFGLEAALVALGHKHARVTETYAERCLALAAQVEKVMG